MDLKLYFDRAKNEIKLAEDVLFSGDNTSISAFADYYRTQKVSQDKDEWEHLSISERITRAVIEARRTDLKENLNQLMVKNSLHSFLPF